MNRIEFMADEETLENLPLKKEWKSENRDKKTGRKKLNNTEILVVVIGAIITSPIWGGALLGIGGTLIGLVAGLISLIFAVGVLAVAMIVAGIGVCIAGVVYAVTGSMAANAVFVMGAGLVVCAIGILITLAIINAAAVFIPWIIRMISKLINRIKGKGVKKNEEV